MSENSILAETNPVILFLGLLMVCGMAWFSALKYKNTNDFPKSTGLYLILALPAGVMLALVFRLDWLLTAGVWFCGWIALGLVSNFYFYH